MGRRGDFTRNGGIAKTCKILSNAGFVLGTPTLARAGETLPDNRRPVARVRRYAGLWRDLWPVDVWYSPYVALQRVCVQLDTFSSALESVNRRALDNPRVLVGGAFQPGDALIQDGDLCHQCGYIGKPCQCLRYLLLSVHQCVERG